jgi:hypothetical protein
MELSLNPIEVPSRATEHVGQMFVAQGHWDMECTPLRFAPKHLSH